MKILSPILIALASGVKIDSNNEPAAQQALNITGYVLPEYLATVTQGTTPLPDDSKAQELANQYTVTYPKLVDFAGWEYFNKKTLKEGVEFFLQNTNKAFRKHMWFDIYEIKNDLVSRMEPNSTQGGVCGSEEHCKGDRFQEEKFFQKGKDVNKLIQEKVHDSNRDPVEETKEILQNNTKFEKDQYEFSAQKLSQQFPRVNHHSAFTSTQRQAKFIVSESDGPKVQWIAERMPGFLESQCQACKTNDTSDQDQYLEIYFQETSVKGSHCPVCNATKQDVVNLAAHFDKIVRAAPMFANSPNLDQAFKGSNEGNKFTFVDRFMMDTQGWEQDLAQVIDADKKIDWANKTSKAFFRGHISGENSTVYDYTYRGLNQGQYTVFNKTMRSLANQTKHLNDTDFPRLNVVIKSVLNPEMIDAKFSTNTDDEKIVFYDAFPKTYNQMFDKTKTIEEHLQYKYLLSVDGKTASWKRPEWIMASNSLLFKTTTPFYQWWYDGLKPYQNYIPVRPDFADLEEKISWAKKHDDIANQIAQNGKIFAQKVFDEKATSEWEFETIANYAKQYSYDIQGMGFKK